MASRRASFASLSVFCRSASVLFFAAGPAASSSLHEGHRFANPGLPGFSSNSSPQATQVLMGYGGTIALFYREVSSSVFLKRNCESENFSLRTAFGDCGVLCS